MSMEEMVYRFKIEPRGSFHGSHSWLVVYDNYEQKYIMDGHAYKRFQHSIEVFEYLRNNY